jgi:hypothetical protein
MPAGPAGLKPCGYVYDDSKDAADDVTSYRAASPMFAAAKAHSSASSAMRLSVGR